MDKIMGILSSMSAMAAAKDHEQSSEEERCSERVLELAEKLDELKIPYKKRNLFGCVDQLVFEWGDGSDIVCYIGSYGHEQGLFEVMGKDLMTKEELERDSVAGNIKMEDAVARIKKAYEKSNEQE
jgi:hypothetical protein